MGPREWLDSVAKYSTFSRGGTLAHKLLNMHYSTSFRVPNRSGTWKLSLIVACHAIYFRVDDGPWQRNRLMRRVLPTAAGRVSIAA